MASEQRALIDPALGHPTQRREDRASELQQRGVGAFFGIYNFLDPGLGVLHFWF